MQSVISFSRPSASEISELLASRDAALTYGEVGATGSPATFDVLGARYDIDRHRFVLGHGRPLFERATNALTSWRHFEIPWLELHGAESSARAGRVVATLLRVAGVWFWNPCRVVYVNEEAASRNEVAFAYGTLPGHVESGEERFAVRFDATTEQVTYEISAFSRPALFVASLARPWARRLQREFAMGSADALARACLVEAAALCV